MTDRTERTSATLRHRQSDTSRNPRPTHASAHPHLPSKLPRYQERSEHRALERVPETFRTQCLSSATCSAPQARDIFYEFTCEFLADCVLYHYRGTEPETHTQTQSQIRYSTKLTPSLPWRPRERRPREKSDFPYLVRRAERAEAKRDRIGLGSKICLGSPTFAKIFGLRPTSDDRPSRARRLYAVSYTHLTLPTKSTV